MGKKKKKIISIVNRSLKHFENAYSGLKKGIEKARDSMPDVFNEIDELIKSHFITLEQSKKLKNDLDFEKFSEVIAGGIIRKLPNLDEKKLKEIIKDETSTSFLDMLTRGLGACTIGGQKEYTIIKKDKLFKKLLIANRGEIAIRIIRACRELGVETIQVYTKQDEKSLAVKFANKAIKIGNKASDYLNMEKIIKIAKKTKADAIHPGYGFLAENAEFAKLCKKNKIKFIGPSYEAILAMGDKINAKKLIRGADVPVLDGTDKTIKEFEEGKKIAIEIGFPVIIKAAAGGGGKGMRIVENEGMFEESFNSCQAEAKSAFGDKRVFVEKYVVDPKHIEFQILADGKGKVIHLGERDCSIQRRHQKLIEEAPSPALNDSLREKMGKAALKVGTAIYYEGAGTVEFLVDKDGNFYFMEMNPRIQVEHGITEMITGIDLVKEQIKIAAGAELTYNQEDIKIDGWAIECRVNAECPEEGFCPITGTVTNYLPPGGPGIRVCSSCQSGQEVSPHYDSLLAKLICGGKTREEAIDRMKRALGEFIIDGVDTTIPFHKTVLSSKAFLKGDITTSFIEKNKIMEKMKKEHKHRKKVLTKDEKAIIITTAVSEYLKKKNRFNDKNSNWVSAARQEAVFNE